MLAQAALLLPLVPKELRDGKPFDRFFVAPLVRRDHSRQSGRHFRPQRDGAFAFVDEVIKLGDDLLAAFDREELQRFQRRAVIWPESITAGSALPALKNILPGVGAPDIGMRQRF